MNHMISKEWIDAQMEKNGAKMFHGALVITKPKQNPCITVFGKGEDGKICKTCSHLQRKRYAKTYIKCDLRPNTNGPGTDHKAGWPACSKYTEESL